MNTALIVIDFINDIVHPDGKIPSCAAHTHERQAISAANNALKWARNNDHLVILVKVGFDAHYLQQPKLSPIFGKADQYQALQLGSWGTDFHTELDTNENDAVVVKSRISPFYATSLEAILRANHIDELYVCGVSTTWAIQATVREAHDRDYTVTIIEDACAASDQEEHLASMEVLKRISSVKHSSDL